MLCHCKLMCPTRKPPITGKPLNFPEMHFMTKTYHKSLFFEHNTSLGFTGEGEIFSEALVPLQDPVVGGHSC